MEQNGIYSRTELLVGTEGIERLKSAKVLVVGLGGVGGYAAEMLCRAGIGHLTLVDSDVVEPTNLNRQIIALNSTIGMAKTDLFRQRIKDINPECDVSVIQCFLRDEAMVELLNTTQCDYVVDAIDTLSPKVFLLYHACQKGVRIVSSMGSAGKMDPSAIQVADISKSHTCPLAAMVRKRLHRLGINHGIKVVFSSEKVSENATLDEPSQNKRTTIGTISYLPPLFGCFVASVVIRDIVDCGID